jgi:hypothetical protein
MEYSNNYMRIEPQRLCKEMNCIENHAMPLTCWSNHPKIHEACSRQRGKREGLSPLLGINRRGAANRRDVVLAHPNDPVGEQKRRCTDKLVRRCKP